MTIWERLLREYEFTYTFQGPDYSGARGGYDPMNEPTEDEPDFPYGKDGELSGYGIPGRFMVGQGRDGGTSALHRPLAAKHLAKSSWDEQAVDEASGTPYVIGKSGAGSSTGGLVAPGRLAGKPEKPWDKDDSDERAERYGKDIVGELTLDPSVGWHDDVPDVGDVPEADYDDSTQQTILRLASDPWGQATDRHVGYMWYQQEGSAWDVLRLLV